MSIQTRAAEGIPVPVYKGEYDANGKATGMHVLAADFEVEGLLSNGDVYRIHIRKGFRFDGASIPRFFWRLCGHPMEFPRICAGIVHDWLYATHAVTRDQADWIYRDICMRVGIGIVCRNVEYRALRLFGGAAWRSHGAEDQREARALGYLEIGGVYIVKPDNQITF